MKRNLILWAVILVGPVVWMLSFGANFALSWWACSLAWKPALYVISILALAITAGSGFVAWNQWQQVGRELPGETGGAVARMRTMAIGGLALSTLFFLVILAQGISETILGACD